MKTFFIESPEVYIAKYAVTAETEEDAFELWDKGHGKEVDLWYSHDLSDVEGVSENTDPAIYTE